MMSNNILKGTWSEIQSEHVSVGLSRTVSGSKFTFLQTPAWVRPSASASGVLTLTSKIDMDHGF